MQPQKHMRQSKLQRNYKETKGNFKSLSIVLFSFFNPAVLMHRGVWALFLPVLRDSVHGSLGMLTLSLYMC